MSANAGLRPVFCTGCGPARQPGRPRGAAPHSRTVLLVGSAYHCRFSGRASARYSPPSDTIRPLAALVEERDHLVEHDLDTRVQQILMNPFGAVGIVAACLVDLGLPALEERPLLVSVRGLYGEWPCLTFGGDGES